MADDLPPPPPPPAPDPLPPPPPSAAPLPPGAIPGLTGEEKQWAMFAHLAGLLALTSIPGGGIVGPLIIWAIKKETMPFVNDQGKEAMNFHITVTIGVVISWLLSFFCIGIPLLIAICVGSVVFSIFAAIKAADGVPYRYPFTLRLIS